MASNLVSSAVWRCVGSLFTLVSAGNPSLDTLGQSPAPFHLTTLLTALSPHSTEYLLRSFLTAKWHQLPKVIFNESESLRRLTHANSPVSSFWDSVGGNPWGRRLPAEHSDSSKGWEQDHLKLFLALSASLSLKNRSYLRERPAFLFFRTDQKWGRNTSVVN